jgi:hypothetical protein
VSKDSQQTDQLCHLSGVLQKTFQGYCVRYIEVQHTFYEIRRSYLGSECTGIPERPLQRHGRWKSTAAKDMYIKDSLCRRLSVSNSLDWAP